MAESSAEGPVYDAGLVVVHGIGQHAKGSFLTRAIGPFLGRMRAEGVLRSVRSRSFAAGVDGSEPLEALDVCYRTSPDADEDRDLLIVEGRWSDAYKRANPAQISAWVFRHEIPMLAQVFSFFARGRWLAVAVGAMALLVAGLILLGSRPDDWPIAVALVVCSVTFAVALASANFSWDAGEHSRELWLGVAGSVVLMAGAAVMTFIACWLVFEAPYGPVGAVVGPLALLAAGVGVVKLLANWAPAQWCVAGLRLVPMAAFSYQRGVVIILTSLGMVLLPVLTALLRVIAGIPGLGIVGLKALQKLEETFFVGSNFGDMHAFADSPARFARIASAVEEALIQVESRVKPGGTVTVMAHSGGAVVSWVLLTEPFATRRLADRRYRVITAGAALNWAQQGFDEPDLPTIDGQFVNQTGDLRTLGAHIYGTWDAVPHGPFQPKDNKPDPIIPGKFNIPARNLGEPSLAEHGEYWNNQEDVVPVIGRAIDPELDWVKRATGAGDAPWALRTNARLGVVAVLTRVRVALLIAPVIAVALLVASFASLTPGVRSVDNRQAGDTETTAADGNLNLLYRAADEYGSSLGSCFTVSQDVDGVKQPLNAKQYYDRCELPSPGENVVWFGLRNAAAGNTVFVVLLWLVALGLLGAYRDLFWRIGGRTDASLTHEQHGIATTWAPNGWRFIGTWIGMGVVPALLWLVPVLAIHAVTEVDRLVYAAGLALSAAIAFAEWMYVRTLVEAARCEDRHELQTHRLAPLYGLLAKGSGRDKAPAKREAPAPVAEPAGASPA